MADIIGIDGTKVSSDDKRPKRRRYVFGMKDGSFQTHEGFAIINPLFVGIVTEKNEILHAYPIDRILSINEAS